MKKKLYILVVLFFPIIFFAQEFRTTRELSQIFSESEITDINTLVDYFESKLKVEGKAIEQCYKDWFWTLQNGGFESEYKLEIFTFENQLKIYEEINQETFNEIWAFESYYIETTDAALKSIRPNLQGKYLDYLRLIGQKRLEVEEYVKYVESSDEYGPIFMGNLFTQKNESNNNWGFRNGFQDYNDRIQLMIITLTSVDLFYRKEKWQK
ncbi:MAG: hypothetical protein QM478_06365 [Flavobacteriaceae bacterium]